MSDAELVFFIALAMEGSEAEALLAGVTDQGGAGDSFDGRSLKVVAVEGAEGPVKFRHGDGRAEAGLDCGFIDRRRGGGGCEIAFGEARGAHAGGESQPGKRLQLFVDVKGFEIGGWVFTSVDGMGRGCN